MRNGEVFNGMKIINDSWEIGRGKAEFRIMLDGEMASRFNLMKTCSNWISGTPFDIGHHEEILTIDLKYTGKEVFRKVAFSVFLDQYLLLNLCCIKNLQ